MDLRITTLSENTAQAMPRGLLGEWGLSVLVEADGNTALLDAGQNVSAANNGEILGINWQKIGSIVLSHGHYDHTGGLRRVLGRIRKQVNIIAHPDAWDAKYAHIPQVNYSAYIGIPFQRQELESLGANFILTREPTWLSESIVTSGEIPMTTDYEVIDPGLCVKRDGNMEPDPLRDDQALFIKTEQGLVVILGCAHRGIINTLRHARQVTGTEAIHTVIGGTHLFRASEVQMELTIAELKEMGIQRLGVSHCTGMLAGARLAQEFGDSFFFNNAGTTITL
ncbi:MAG: MBL fold metallo-hydrolase [Chloroflexi bacterium]|nr:MAG: MBL fold metallo-hydrolase [Chloroflexota bacterium]